VDGLLAAGGAQAIAALAYGAGPVPGCDVVVGPGNRYVTAAKQLVSGAVGIDALAGPSELVIVADRTADPSLVAADLLAQAEHDPDALVVLVSLDASLPPAVEAELARQIADLPTAAIARAALARGGWVEACDLRDAARIADAVAPEHLHLMLADAWGMTSVFNSYGAVFIGAEASVVLGDYGAGPNHTLPTGGSARWSGGLSVLTYLRVRTWMRMDASPTEAIRDAMWLAREEGLEGHARAAARRAV
jgi:phosphoribosyl-ATP pyrophosphohydrolase/phosphoribosyl-AMP cyclohydrolase/histidinol dehydrogenase